MINFCTLSDYKFLPQGLALYESLLKHNSDFNLHYLCLDKKCYSKLSSLKINNINPYSLDGLENTFEELQKIKNNPPSFEAKQVSTKVGLNANQMEYYWVLASWFSNFLLPELSSITYLDSDLYFFDDWTKAIDAVGDRSIGLVRNNSSNDKVNGQFNVSFVHFKNDLLGSRALMSWKNWVCQFDDQYVEQYGNCGDQKYLELFPELFGQQNICILDDEGTIQLAPWSTIKTKSNPLFYHFSGLKYNDRTYFPAERHGLMNRCQLTLQQERWYDEYCSKVLEWKVKL